MFSSITIFRKLALFLWARNSLWVSPNVLYPLDSETRRQENHAVNKMPVQCTNSLTLTAYR